MNMMQYRDFHYSDSDTFSPNNGNAATATIKETEIDEEYETKRVEQLESGEQKKKILYLSPKFRKSKRRNINLILPIGQIN